MQARLHAARPALSHRVRNSAVRVCSTDEDHNPSVRPVLYPLMACITVCLSCLEELSLDLGNLDTTEQDASPSILAPLAGLPHLARLSVEYPDAADIPVLQVGPAGG